MKTPELGDVIVTRNGMRWICATRETIRKKVGVDPDIHYAGYPIKAYNVDEDSFNVWTGDETCGYAIAEVIPATTVRPQVQQKPRKHSELIKAWADGADIEWYDPGTEKWESISGPPSWRKDDKYRVKTTRQLSVRITQDGRMVLCNDGNLLLTFDLSGKLVSAEVK